MFAHSHSWFIWPTWSTRVDRSPLHCPLVTLNERREHLHSHTKGNQVTKMTCFHLICSHDTGCRNNRDLLCRKQSQLTLSLFLLPVNLRHIEWTRRLKRKDNNNHVFRWLGNSNCAWSRHGHDDPCYYYENQAHAVSASTRRQSVDIKWQCNT